MCSLLESGDTAAYMLRHIEDEDAFNGRRSGLLDTLTLSYTTQHVEQHVYRKAYNCCKLVLLDFVLYLMLFELYYAIVHLLMLMRHNTIAMNHKDSKEKGMRFKEREVKSILIDIHKQWEKYETKACQEITNALCIVRF